MVVYITKTGKKYHLEGSRYLKNSVLSMQVEEAEKRGYIPSEEIKESSYYQEGMAMRAYVTIRGAVRGFERRNNFHYHTICMDFEDVVSDIMLRLIDKKAFNKFDPRRVKFSTYIATIANRYLMNLRRDTVRRMNKLTNTLIRNTGIDPEKLLYA